MTNRIKALQDALTLAANRLQRIALDFDTGSRRFVEVLEWADESRAALAASQPAQPVKCGTCPGDGFITDRSEPDGLDYCPECRKRDAASQPSQPVAVKVKPLVWKETNNGNHKKGEVFSARSLIDFAPIAAHKKHDGWWLNMDCKTYPTLEAAKAAAQADYDARIMAALDVQPLTVQDAALVPEIAAMIEDMLANQKAWRTAITECKTQSDDGSDLADMAYWHDALAAFDRVFIALRAIAEGRA